LTNCVDSGDRSIVQQAGPGKVRAVQGMVAQFVEQEQGPVDRVRDASRKGQFVGVRQGQARLIS